MSLRTELKKNMLEARKNENSILLSNISSVLGELDRQKNRDLSDDDILSIIKKLKNTELEFLDSKGEKTSSFLEYLDSLLPKQVSREDIIEWIDANVDFSSLKNKMQAVGLVMKQFGQSSDGKIVKELIMENY